MTISEMMTQAMYEREVENLWESITAPNPNMEKFTDASYSLEMAYEHICKAMDSMYEAVKELEGTEAEDRVTSLMNDLEDIQCDIDAMKNRLERGEC